MTMSNFAENAILNHRYGRTTYTAPATVYIALFTTAPDFEAGTGGTEVSGGSYARAAVTNDTTNWPNASAGSKSNGTQIDFPTPTAGWGTVVAFGIYDAATAGNLLDGATLSTSKTINSGDPTYFPAGSLTFTLN